MLLPRLLLAAALTLSGVFALVDPAAATPTDAMALGSAPLTLPQQLRGVHDARQLIVVTATDNRTTRAVVRGYRKRGGIWHRVLGPWPARLGFGGFASRDGKREGDSQTPSGSFTVPFGFGVAPDPGSRLHYRRALSTSRWDDDSASSNYNRWVDTRYGDPGRSPEHMHVLPDYRYGVVIGYNRQRTPGMGSAIFFHIDDGDPTLGCVTVVRDHVVRVLRWLRPGLHPRFIMGTRASMTR